MTKEYETMENKNVMEQSLNITRSKKLLRGSEAAQILDCSTAYVHQLIREGRLPGVYLGRVVRIRQEDLDAFIAAGGSKERGVFKHV
jgi:excisionase family DNA binding protein